MTKFSPFLSTLLAYIIAFQPVLLAQSSPSHQSVRPADLRGNQITKPSSDRKKLDHFHYEQSLVIPEEAETREFPLDLIATDNPSVAVADFDQEVKVEYDAQNKELRFVRIFSGKNGIINRMAEHIFYGVELTDSFENTFLDNSTDPNLVFLSTKNGLEVIYKPLLRQLLFKAAVPTFKIAASAGAVMEGRKISRISYLTPETPPLDLTSYEDGKMVEAVNTNDIILETVDATGANPVSIHLDYFQNVTKTFAPLLGLYLVKVGVANHNPHLIEDVTSIYETYSADFQTIMAGTSELVSSSSDLQQETLARVSLQLTNEKGFERLLELFKKDPNGRNALQRTMNASHDRFSIAEWRGRNEIVSNSRATGSKLHWRQILIEEKEKMAPVVAESIVQANKTEQHFIVRLLKRAKNLAFSTKGIPVLTIATDLATNGRLGSLAHDFFSNAFSHVYALPHFPVVSHLLGSLADKIAEKAEYFSNSYAATSISISILSVLMYRPVLMGAAWLWSKAKGRDEGMVRSFFRLGIKWYAYAGYPVWKLFWSGILRQKNIYPALNVGASIFDPGVFHLTNSQKAVLKLDNHLRRTTALKMRAQVVAAALVSQNSTDSAAPVDPASLLLAFQKVQNSDLSPLFSSEAAENASWQILFSKVYRELEAIHDEGIGQLDQQTIRNYYNIFLHLKEEMQNHPNFSVWDKMTLRWDHFKTWTTKKFIPLVFFGKQGFDVFNRYKNYTIDDRNLDTSYQQFRSDFDGSVLSYAIFDPQTFGEAARGNILEIQEVTGNQVEQVAVWGMQGPIDAIETHRKATSFVNISPPLTNQSIDLSKTYKDGGAGRVGTFRESVAHASGSFLDPNKETTLIDTQISKMRAHIEGFQSRFLQGFVPRALLFGLGSLTAALVVGQAIQPGALASESLSAAVQAVPSQLAFFFDKYALFSLQSMIGYAAVWGGVTHFTNLEKNQKEANKAALAESYAKIDEGLRLKAKVILINGLSELKSLFKNPEMMPEEFRKDPDLFTDEESLSFLSWAKEHAPVSTIKNSRYISLINWAGVLLSTIFFVDLSNKVNLSAQAMIAQNAVANGSATPAQIDLANNFIGMSIWETGLTSAGLFAATYFGLKVAKPILNKTTRRVRKLFGLDKCALGLTQVNDPN